MKISEITAGLRGLINQYSETDTPYTDAFLYHIFSTASIRLIKQKEERNQKLSDWTLKYYPLALEVAKSHDFGCYPSCDILKTIFKIPKPITARNRDIFKVYTFDHKQIAYVHPSYAPLLQYDEIKKNKLHYSIIDEYVVIWNANVDKVIPRAILVAGRFEDPTQWSEIPYCDKDGNSTEDTCYDIYSEDFPMEGDLIEAAYKICLQMLGITLQIPDDRVNEQK